MIIVVEGPDGAGKTTLCELMLEHSGQLGVPAMIVHHGPSPVNPMTAYMREISDHERTLERSPSLLIMDRFHYGDLVYGTSRRTSPRLKLADFSYLNQMLFRLGGRVVIMIPPVAETLRRLHEKEEEPPVRLHSERAMFELLGKTTLLDAPKNVRIIDKVMDRRETKFVADTLVYKTLKEHVNGENSGDQDQGHAIGVPNSPPSRQARFESIAEGTFD